jgi:hypothetical protein
LEEAQRARRKQNEANKKKHQPRWFTEETDPESNFKEYIYQGGYWEAREKNDYGDLL